MTDLATIATVLIIASNPLALGASLTSRPAESALYRAAAAGLAILLALVLAGPNILDALDIEPETFRIATGVVFIVSGAAAILPFANPRPIDPVRDAGPVTPWLFPIAWPGIATAAACIAASNYSANDGRPVTLTAAAISVAISLAVLYATAGRYGLMTLAASRFLGGIIIVTGVDLVISGVQSV